MNSLVREVGLKMGPVFLGTLVKHWFDRLKNDAEDDNTDSGARLKEGDILYHQAFTLIKAFLEASTNHTIEDVQSFANTRTISPPWVHVVRTLVPLTSCDEAAVYLVKALGGEDAARRNVGGIKWWQVRGVQGIQAQWITAKKDWEEAKKRHKMQQEQASKGSAQSVPPLMHAKAGDSQGDSGAYDKDMDAMRCILYLHGGGYYFGSVDQTRYSIQRHARKLNGRVFAIDYRLAPQYPFPCGLHDALAAYLFLIRPPSGSSHEAVNPAHIIVSGDSAGGGLSLALLQVIRDSGLPLPAGGVLISPWCDLTHSFPSLQSAVHNDIIPESGLSFHKPSLLWPPPSPDISKRVHASLRSRIKQVFKPDTSGGQFSQTSTIVSEKDIQYDATSEPLSPVSPLLGENGIIKMSSGEIVEIKEQIHFYTQNSLLSHPLVSPITSYLGGLPPLLFIAGDDEVLRDEIIYTAHKAAYPEKYPVTEHSRALYPVLQGIEHHHKPTSVHLQIYDGTPHILPVLFSFTVPAKFCFRAIANFNRFVTDMKAMPSRMRKSSLSSSSTQTSSTSRPTLLTGLMLFPRGSHVVDEPLASSPVTPPGPMSEAIPPLHSASTERPHFSFSRKISSHFHPGTLLRRYHTVIPTAKPLVHEHSTEHFPFMETMNQSPNSSGDNGQLSTQDIPHKSDSSTESNAGEPEVYVDIKNRSNWECRMIRERVSTSGVIRPLEPEEELDALKVAPERVAQLTEAVIRRYLKHKQKFDKKYEQALKSIEKDRYSNIARAKQETIKRIHVLRQTIGKEVKVSEILDRHHVDGITQTKAEANSPTAGKSKVDWQALSSPGWAWAWVLDDFEHPPSSSIVARRDTEEARKLAAVADLIHTRDEDHNDLWTTLYKFFTGALGKETAGLIEETSSKHTKAGGLEGGASDENQPKGSNENENQPAPKKHSSTIFANLPLVFPTFQNET